MCNLNRPTAILPSAPYACTHCATDAYIRDAVRIDTAKKNTIKTRLNAFVLKKGSHVTHHASARLFFSHFIVNLILECRKKCDYYTMTGKE